MLPPHYKFPTRQPWQSFFRRLVDWKQIDWDSTFTQVIFALLYPSKLALISSHRLQTQGHLWRGDPGVFLCLLYLVATSGLAYGSAFVASHHAHERAIQIESRWQSIGIVFSGFVLWPLLLTATLTVGLSFALLFMLQRVAQFPRRSIAFSIASTMRPAVNVLFDDNKSSQQSSDENTAVSTTIYSADAATVDWAYCFDLICNGSIAGIFILSVAQYLVLPIIVARSSPALLAAFTSNLLHVMASFTFVYNVAAGVAILRSPLWRAASMMFAPLAIWVLILLILSMCKINVTAAILEVMFTPFLPVERVAS